MIYSKVLGQIYFSIRAKIALESCLSRGYLITSFNELKFVTRILTVLLHFVAPSFILKLKLQNKLQLYVCSSVEHFVQVRTLKLYTV